jgi:hypothetical protein
VGNTVVQGATNNVVTYNRAGTYTLKFSSSDGGTTVAVEDLSRNQDPVFYPGKEDLAASGTVNLGVTNSYFTTAGSETATMAAGVEGQIKNFMAVDVTAGNMVITVNNAGWKASGSGTITFDARGEACQLIYINAKWYCIGNNDCTFA